MGTNTHADTQTYGIHSCKKKKKKKENREREKQHL